MATNHKRNIFIIIHSKKSDNINKIKDNDLLKKKNVVSGKKKIFDIIKDTNKKDEKHVSFDLDDFNYIKEYQTYNYPKINKQNCNNTENKNMEDKKTNKNEKDILNEDFFVNLGKININNYQNKIHNKI